MGHGRARRLIEYRPHCGPAALSDVRLAPMLSGTLVRQIEPGHFQPWAGIAQRPQGGRDECRPHPGALCNTCASSI